MSDMNDFILSKLDKLDEKLEEIKEHNAEYRSALKSHELNDDIMRDDMRKMGVQLEKQCELLSQYNESLKEHMRRTDILEKRQDHLDIRLQPIEDEREDREAVEKHKKATIKKWLMILSVIATVVGIIAGIVELM